MHSIFYDIKNAFSKPNNSLMQLIVINLVVFVLLNAFQVVDYFIQSKFLYAFATDWIFLKAYLPELMFKPWTILTYAFCQVGFMHVLGNLIGLYWFGRIIDDMLGSSRVIGLYVWGAIIGALFFILGYNLIPQFADRLDVPLIGASGGVIAIVVGAATLVPDYRFNLVFLGSVKITWIAAAFVIMSFIGLKAGNAGGELAHLGGALMGYLFVAQLRKGVEYTKPIIWTMDMVKSVFEAKPKMKVSHRSRSKSTTAANSKTTSTPQSEIDAILDKISESGYESLSKSDKQKLFAASQKNKQ